jgi:hypothetical protein
MNVHSAKVLATSVIALGLMSGAAHATFVAQWTFETSLPATAGPFTAEVGTGSASGFHAGASTYSSPAGNGSAHSFSSNTWSVGDYYQFSTSTLGYSGISLSWDQTGSNTGPANFKLAYSTNGTSFTDFLNYSVINSAWSSGTAVATTSFSSNLATVTPLNNQSAVYFRLIDTSTTAINGATVAPAGTGRVDNFTVNGTGTAVVPVPPSAGLLAAGLGMLGFIARRRAASV